MRFEWLYNLVRIVIVRANQIILLKTIYMRTEAECLAKAEDMDRNSEACADM